MAIVDCVYERGQFFLPLSLNGSGPQYFIFDTGAGVSAVDEALSDELGLPKVAHTELAGTAEDDRAFGHRKRRITYFSVLSVVV